MTDMNPIEAAGAIGVKYSGSETRITLPSSLLWLLVFGGIAMLTWNASIVHDQLKEQDRRLMVVETDFVNHEASRTGHELSTRFQLMLEQRLSEIEIEARQQEAEGSAQ